MWYIGIGGVKYKFYTASLRNLLSLSLSNIYIHVYKFGCHSLESRVLKRDKYALFSCEMDRVHFILQIRYYKFRDEILSHDSKF